MISFHLVLRYIEFGLFIACNAIIASVAVWNLSVAQELPHPLNFPVIFYLIFVGCLALIVIFGIIFTEITLPNPITRRVWFECTWVALFAAMELSGAIGLTVTVPVNFCSSGGCRPAKLLLAFSWMCAITLIFYLFILCVAILAQWEANPQVWWNNIHDLRSFKISQFKSPLSTPALPCFQEKTPTIHAPKPRRPPPTHIYAYQGGLGSEYEIEHYQPPGEPIHRASNDRPIRELPFMNDALRLPASSLYSHSVQATMDGRRMPQQILSYQAAAPVPGKWGKVHPTQRPDPPAQLNRTLGSPQSPSFRPPRPSGPRKLSISGHERRPPPLDLSKISTYSSR